MYTLKDIAREANVSVTTVSNVIHGNHKRVAKGTIDRINKIIEENNYVPNMTARSLVNKLSKIIGVINYVTNDCRGNFISDPFHSVVIAGIEETLREKGYYLMIRTVHNEEELISLLRNWNMDGLILIGAFQNKIFERLSKAKVPIMLVDSYIDNDKVSSVGIDDFEGGYLATRYLIDKGHRNIVFASPQIRENGVVEERFKGFKKAIEEGDITLDRENIYEGEITIAEGIQLGRELSKRDDITAVFATADILAAGIISGLNENGKRVPEDISIVGFDNLYISSLTVPRITTVDQDVHKKGSVAAETLINIVEGKEKKKRNIIMPVSVIERDSVKEIIS